MNIDVFSTCLSSFGAATGVSALLEGVYSPSSGHTSGFYNQIYTTGYHFANNLFYAQAIPLIDVYGRRVGSNNVFSGNHCFRAGYKHSGNFGILMDIEYSGCSKSNTVGSGLVLLSTVETFSGLSSGFMIGINDANRLYFRSSGRQETLSEELGTRDFIYVALTEKQYVDFGIFKIDRQQYYNKTARMDSGVFTTSDIYFGNWLNNARESLTTGFSGKINQILLFNDDLSDRDVGICSNCSLATGYSWVTQVQNVSGFSINGISFSGVQVVAVTGLVNATGTVKRGDGSSMNVIYQSGVTGYQSSGEVVIPVFTQTIISITGSGCRFAYDSGAIDQLTRFTIEFDYPLTSGDFVEIYTYPMFNKDVGKRTNGFVWPNETGVVQLIGNGLNETSGIDYSVTKNTIVGFSSDYILSYDVLPSQPIVTDYSGYWAWSKVQLSGGSFFPPSAQYYESAAFTGKSKITGLDRISTGNVTSGFFGFDLYLNGQKLVNNNQYDISGGENPYRYVVTLYASGLPLLAFDSLYSPPESLPTGVTNVSSSELTFTPQFSGFKQTSYTIVGDTKVIGPITGYSEQIWINGIRQIEDVDYTKRGSCDFVTGFVYPPSLTFPVYRSQTDSKNRWRNYRI